MIQIRPIHTRGVDPKVDVKIATMNSSQRALYKVTALSGQHKGTAANHEDFMPGSQSKIALRLLGSFSRTRAALDLKDHELIGRFLSSHDEEAFGTLVKRHAAMVLGVCRRHLQNVQDAEDACQ